MTSERTRTATVAGRPDAGGSAPARDARVYRVEVEPHGCFVCGQLNEIGLRIRILSSGGRAWTTLALEPAYQGWDRVAHGGILAALLDELLLWALFEHDCWGVTAELTVRYRRPVPIGRPIRVEGWVTDARRRRFTAEGRIVDATDGSVLCTAEGTYLGADEARKVELKARYRFRLVPAPEEAVPPDPRPGASSSATDGEARGPR